MIISLIYFQDKFNGLKRKEGYIRSGLDWEKQEETRGSIKNLKYAALRKFEKRLQKPSCLSVRMDVISK